MTTPNYPTVSPNPNFAELEEEILAFWQAERVFETSVKNRPSARDGQNNEYVFYDGPPFANGLPHYGHLLTGYVKDAVARYQTMRGKRVERRFGWDCHGLPAEMGAEKELGISGRAAITQYGIGKFNEHCRTSVMKYTADWEYYVNRQGRWVDFKNDYKTMDTPFMESCLWAFKELYNKGLIYESMRVMPYSWAAETPVSNFETRIDNATREREDKAAYVKFELTPESAATLKSKGAPDAENYYLIAWTTTPWTLPSNLALAVNAEIEYFAYVNEENQCMIATFAAIEKLAPQLSARKSEKDAFLFEGAGPFLGQDLIGLTYEPLFPYFADTPNAFCVLDGSEFVTDGDGTGIVHMAPGFGEVDQACCANANPPIEVIVPVDEKGRFTDAIYDIEWITPHQRATLADSPSGRELKEEHSSSRGELRKNSSPPEGEQALPQQSRGGYEAILTQYARTMRKEPTPWENALWQRLKGEQLGGFKFRRQQPIASYIADFYNADKRVIIEVDGSQHADNVADTKRDEALQGLGHTVIRVWNNEIDTNLDGVCEAILAALESAPHRAADAGAAPPQGGSEVLSLRNLIVVPDTRIAVEDIVVSEQDKARHISEKDVAKYGLANMRIVRWLKANNALVKDETYKHNYPHCWRTDTPLIYRAMSSWYVNVQKIKANMAENNLTIHWIPDHIQSGQMGKGIESAPDWSISRNRFWGTPIPIWRREDWGFSHEDSVKVFGSIAEMEDFFDLDACINGDLNPKSRIPNPKITDLHRPFIDTLTIAKDGSRWTRIEDVFDCWFESGSMPYAQLHYPFENKELFEKNFPADFITEYIAQTRGWFYTLQVLSAALFGCAPFKNVICHGVVIDEETGLKYSKRLKNYRDPKEVMDQFGADALRWMMLASPVMRGADLGVDPEGKFIRDVVRLNIKPIWNAYNFFTLYANADGIKAEFRVQSSESSDILDRYILAKCRAAVEQVRASLDAYDTPSACEAITAFFEVLNNWYIRRSKDRFWSTDAINDSKQAAYDTLFTVLNVMCKAAAPLLPFTTEAIYRGLNASPHQRATLADSPSGGELKEELSSSMGELNNPSSSSSEQSKNLSSPLEGEQALPLVHRSLGEGGLQSRGGNVSVHLQDFPDVANWNSYHLAEQLLISDVDQVRHICNAALAVRNNSNNRVRQPLQRLTVYNAMEHVVFENGEDLEEMIKDEVNVKEVHFANPEEIDEVATMQLAINAKVVGKRYPTKTKDIILASKKGEWKILAADDRGVTKVELAGIILENTWSVIDGAEPDYEFVVNLVPKDNKTTMAMHKGNALVILDLTITPELEAEGLARDLVRMIQQARKDSGFDVSDRINLTLDLPNSFAGAMNHKDYIATQTLAASVTQGKDATADKQVTQDVDGEIITIGLSKVA